MAHNPHIVSALSGGLGGRSTEDGVFGIGNFERTVGAAEILSERRGSNGLRRRDSPAPIEALCFRRQLSDVLPPSPLQTQVVDHDASRRSVELDSDGSARRGLHDRGRSLDSVGQPPVAPLVELLGRIQLHSRFGLGRNADR